MHFHDTDEQAAFRSEARSWLEAHARGLEGDWSMGPADDTHEAELAYFAKCREWQRVLYDGGWAAITWPEKFGGRGGKPWQNIIFGQEQAKYRVNQGFLRSAIALVGPTLMRHGNTEQHDKYLSRLLRGDDMWCQLFSEPDAGSDLPALQTKAVKDGDEWVVTGQKVWTSNGHLADYGILLARTDPDADIRKGISFFIVDMKSAGLTVRPLVQITGTAHFNEVFLDEVRIPSENLVGEINDGWAAARTTLANESSMIGSGANRENFDDLVGLARDRGNLSNAVVRQRLAGAWADEKLMSLMRMRLQSAVMAGKRPTVDGSVLKLFWSTNFQRRYELVVDLLGADGLLAGDGAPADGWWNYRWLYSRGVSIGGGTSEIHRNKAAERVLGLPREPA